MIVLYAFLFDVGTSETLIALFALIILDFISGITASKISGQPVLIIGEKSIVFFEGTSDVNDAFTSCRFSGALVRDVDA